MSRRKYRDYSNNLHLIHKQVPGSVLHAWYKISERGSLVEYCSEGSERYRMMASIIKKYKAAGYNVTVTK